MNKAEIIFFQDQSRTSFEEVRNFVILETENGRVKKDFLGKGKGMFNGKKQ